MSDENLEEVVEIVEAPKRTRGRKGDDAVTFPVWYTKDGANKPVNSAETAELLESLGWKRKD